MNTAALHQYVAYCWQCAGGGKQLGAPGTKKRAEREATSHVMLYGHHVSILNSKEGGK